MEKFFRNFANRSNNHKKHSPMQFLAILMFLILGWIGTGFYTIRMEQLGVVLKFGKAHRILEPGWHYCLPYPIEQVKKVDATSVRRIDSAREYEATTLVLTGDENIASVHFYVLWNVNNPKDFLFENTQPEETIKAAANSIIREIIAQNQFEKILTINRDSIAQKAHTELQKFADNCKLGVQIVEVQLGKVDPPNEKVLMQTDTSNTYTEECVIDSYREVQKAKADFERSRNDAESYENYIIPTSRGEAEKIRRAAQAYQIQTVMHAQGEAEQFKLLSVEHNKNPEIIKARLTKEYKQKLMSSAQQIIFGNNKQNIPMLNFGNIQTKTQEK